MIRTFLLAALALSLSAQVKVTQKGNSGVAVEIDGKPFTELVAGPNVKKPYLNPLRSASGAIVTLTLPAAGAPAAKPDEHPHHRGLWFSHGNVNGYDFWANDADQQGANKGKGTIVLKSIERVSSGKNKGSVDAVFEWKDAQGQLVLIERRNMTFTSDQHLRILDFDATLSPEGEVKFGDTKEGMFAIRLAESLQEDKGGKLVNAQNKAGEKNVWGKRSEWANYSGQIDGKAIGVAIFDHPSNPRYPTYWHARAYGLFATNIFGLHDFENDPSRDAGLTIRPGQPLRFRFRVVIHEDVPQIESIRQMYSTFSALR